MSLANCVARISPKYIGDHLMQETIWLNGWPVATFSAGVLYYANPDHLGTPRSSATLLNPTHYVTLTFTETVG
jgi:hypothetical protein